MTAPAVYRWTYAVSSWGWVGDETRVVVLGWDVAEPSVFAICATDPVTGSPVEWWLERRQAAAGVDGVTGEWMWQCTRDGVPHVAVRPLIGAEVLVREDALGRFLAGTEYWASLDCAGFQFEVTEILGGGS